MTPTITRVDVPQERPAAGRPGAAEVDIASGGAGPRPVEDGASAAAEARRSPVQAIVARLQGELGIRTPALSGYGPTSLLSEELLWRGYGLGEEAR